MSHDFTVSGLPRKCQGNLRRNILKISWISKIIRETILDFSSSIWATSQPRPSLPMHLGTSRFDNQGVLHCVSFLHDQLFGHSVAHIHELSTGSNKVFRTCREWLVTSQHICRTPPFSALPWDQTIDRSRQYVIKNAIMFRKNIHKGRNYSNIKYIYIDVFKIMSENNVLRTLCGTPKIPSLPSTII